MCRCISSTAMARITTPPAPRSAISWRAGSPRCPVLGLTTSLAVARRLAAVWGVHAITTQASHSMTQAVEQARQQARLEGFAGKGEEIVVVAGVPFGQAGTTNALRVARI